MGGVEDLFIHDPSVKDHLPVAYFERYTIARLREDEPDVSAWARALKNICKDDHELCVSGKVIVTGHTFGNKKSDSFKGLDDALAPHGINLAGARGGANSVEQAVNDFKTNPAYPVLAMTSYNNKGVNLQTTTNTVVVLSRGDKTFSNLHVMESTVGRLRRLGQADKFCDSDGRGRVNILTIEITGAAPPALPTTPTPTAARTPAPATSPMDEVRKAHTLMSEGILSPEEYETIKRDCMAKLK